MKKTIALLLLPQLCHAADLQTIWGDLPKGLSKQSLSQQLKPLQEKNGHTRYQLLYKGLPVWGHQLIKHAKGKIAYSGQFIQGIEKDVASIVPKLSKEDVLKQFEGNNVKQLTQNLVIYMDGQKARLAYHQVYFEQVKNKFTQPHRIIDANSGEILKTFDGLHRNRLGQGPGGNYTQLTSRQSDFQYGNLAQGQNALGRFEVTINGRNCIVANKNFEIINMQNRAFDWDTYPILASNQSKYKAFSYPCNKSSQYVNRDDGGYAPAHDGLSPINDAMYFAQTTLDMYQNIYGDDKPFGDDLPIRAYTHVANFDNAFALSTGYDEGEISYHQQIVLGNGEYYFAPLSQTTLPHELSHNVTAQYADLVYEGQSGGINEAFSDMADLALRDYVKGLYPWYWNGKDWSIGREETLSGIALRYMEKPSDDGYSIDSAKDYYPCLDVHYSSGVFNRAFYLLAHQKDWSVQNAFQVMFDANRYYWVPNTNYDFAACGVIQAAEDRKWDTHAVIDAFKRVGVDCPLI